MAICNNDITEKVNTAPVSKTEINVGQINLTAMVVHSKVTQSPKHILEMKFFSSLSV